MGEPAFLRLSAKKYDKMIGRFMEIEASAHIIKMG